MDLSKLKQKIPFNIGKYKYIFLVLAVGLVFILLPTGSDKKAATVNAVQTDEISYISQAELAAILSRIKGAGRVEVMLSLESSPEIDYQTDQDGGNSTAGRSATVTVTDSERNETGLVSKTDAPVYRGAIVVCDGADIPSVQLSVINAVSNITGLRTNQISVLKME